MTTRTTVRFTHAVPSRLLVELQGVQPAEVDALAAAIESDGGPLHEALAECIRSVGVGTVQPSKLAALRLSRQFWPEAEVDELIGELADAEPWGAFKSDLIGAERLTFTDPLPDSPNPYPSPKGPPAP
jgi:hypothetical protein